MVLWDPNLGSRRLDVDKGDIFIGILVRRFDNYVENKIASRNYAPSWAWEIKFTRPKPPINYNQRHGAAEINLKNGGHGKILRMPRE